MSDFPSTRISLLRRLRDPRDHEAWSDFVALYQPAIYRFARRRGLQEADAHDLVQQVFTAVAQRIDRWQPDADRAKFRTWLGRVAANQAITLYRRHQRHRARGGSSVVERLQQIPETIDDSLELRNEVRRQLFRHAASLVRLEFEESTWQAFWLVAVRQVPVADAARSLGRTTGSIYTARSRVMRRLQEIVRLHQQDDDSLFPTTSLESPDELHR